MSRKYMQQLYEIYIEPEYLSVSLSHLGRLCLSKPYLDVQADDFLMKEG